MKQPTVLLLALSLAGAALAGTRTWDGDAGSPHWNTVGVDGVTNWTHKAELAQPVLRNGDRLVFAGRVGLISQNNFAALSVAGLDFAPGAGAFHLSGNALTLTGSVRNLSGELQHVGSMELVAAADQTWDGGSAGLQIDRWRVDAGALRLAGTIKFQADWAPAIGVTGAASLLVDGGRQLRSSGLLLGAMKGASGSLLLSGAGTSWEMTGPLQAGILGTGQLTVAAGAAFSSQGALLGLGPNGQASLVSGAGSRWEVHSDALQVGKEGRLQVTQGGLLRTEGTSLFGQIVVQGGDSQWQDQQWVWVRGSGQALIEAGARARFGALTLSDGGYLSVQGSGSRLDARSALLASGGSFALGAGGEVVLGSLQGAAGSQLSLRGGRLQVADLRLDAAEQLDWQGGTLALPSLQLGGANAPLGALLVLNAGSTLALAGELRVEADGLLQMRAGAQLEAERLHLAGGTVLRQGDASWQLQSLTGHGLLGGGSTVQGQLDPEGLLQFGGGDLSLAAGSLLRLDLADGASFDRLAGMGSLQLGGSLQLSFGAGVAASVQAMRFDLLDFERFGAGFSTDQVQIFGLDPTRVDLSRLALDGSIGVSAVPEPAPAALLATGLVVLSLMRRRGVGALR